MANQHTEIQKIYIEHFEAIYQRCPEELVSRIKSCIDPHALEIAQTFYQTIDGIGDISDYLSTEQVIERLIPSMANWISELFKIRSRSEALEYIEQQFHIGQVHARIKLPHNLFNCGVRVIKREIKNHLVALSNNSKDYHEMSQLVDMLIDTSSSLMNESYFIDLIQIDRQSQSLQLQVMGQSLALKCEKLRAEAFSWQIRTLNQLIKSGSQIPQNLPLISHSDIGMWITHKASLYFKDNQEVQSLNQQLHEMDQLLEMIITDRQNGNLEKSAQGIEELNEHIMSFTALLSKLSELSVALESGRDTLTKLLNRRFLDTVMQRETSYSIRNKTPYAVMLVDIDHFKAINDKYGHQAGDDVLAQLAETLSLSVRAADFLFRYGGEEFLLLLPDIKLDAAEKLANNLRDTISKTSFESQSSSDISVTVSIGLAMHEFSSDYKRIINQADQALYAAKKAGRNRCVVAA
jgi:diguanylate cyclase